MLLRKYLSLWHAVTAVSIEDVVLGHLQGRLVYRDLENLRSQKRAEGRQPQRISKLESRALGVVNRRRCIHFLIVRALLPRWLSCLVFN